MDKRQAIATVKEKQTIYKDVSDRIWEYAELAFREYQSAALLCHVLEQEGFAVEKGVAGIETAFTASFGTGKPVIGILGEYDALSGLNQMADATCPQPVCPEQEGMPGHGCGHNLFAAGALAAAVAVKEYLKDRPGKGTVVFFGCPGEEGGSGKTFMAREGMFDGLEAAITWHPSDKNKVPSGSNLANIQVRYSFSGISSHASVSPQRGRSALDAAELMNIGIQFLREHMKESDRIHYSFADSGSISPNVVQAKASMLYLIRSATNAGAQDLKRRVDLVAQGAATMTETTVESRLVKACSNVIPNFVLEEVLQKNMEQAELPVYTEQELELARTIRMTYAPDAAGPHMAQNVEPYVSDLTIGRGSTDVGDVSWVCPTAQIRTAVMPRKAPLHSWQQVALGKSSLGHKGVLLAGEVMAGAVIDLMEDPLLLEKARQEHQRRLAGKPYVCPIPKGICPEAL